MKFKHRQNTSLEIEVRIVDTSGGGVLTEKGYEVAF